MKSLTALVLVAVLTTSCFKDKIKPKDCPYSNQECDSGSFYLGNRTDRVIFFSEGGSEMDRMVRPGQEVVLRGGYVKTTHDRRCSSSSSYSYMQGIMIDNYYWSVKMDRCTKKGYFAYDTRYPDDKIIEFYEEGE